MRKNDSLAGSFDWLLFSAYIVMLVIGVATVYSTAYNEDHPNLFDFSQMYGRQIMWLGISLFLGLLVFLIDSDIYRKFAIPIYIFVCCLLLIVLFMPAVNGAHAWLGIGSMGIQPAEFAKIGTALIIARYLSTLNLDQQNINTVLVANGLLLIPMALILMQPDAGTFVVFTSFLFVLYREGVTYDPLVLKIVNRIPGVKFRQTWVGSHFIPILFVVVILAIVTLLLSNETLNVYLLGNIPGYYGLLITLFIICLIGFIIMRAIFPKRDRKRAFLIALFTFVLAGAISYSVDLGFRKLAPHQKERIELLLGLIEDQDGKDYNRNRAFAAVGSGDFLGKGYRNATLATVSNNHVPESETDFIFCPFAEEWGFVGSFVLISIYLFMLIRIVIIAERQRSTFNRVYAYCVAMILFYHVAINIGMNIEFAPVIGIPLPFMSYGGSSMMSFSMMMLILLKLDSQRKDVLS